MEFFKTQANELSELSDFYFKCGYGGTFDGSDEVFYVVDDGYIIGVVRIALEQDTFVLRGMQVAPNLRGNKIGRKLLSYMMEQISQIKASFYCLPHKHLAKFYGDAGFVDAGVIDVPEFLIKRKLKYETQGLSIDLLVHCSAL